MIITYVIISYLFISDENCQSANEHQSVCSSDHQHQHFQQLQSHIVLSELPEPPIPVSEIGLIPPPPMFSTPSPTMVAVRQNTPQSHSSNLTNMGIQHSTKMEFNEYDYNEDDSDIYRYPDEVDSEEEYMLQQNISTMRVEEIPVKEPLLNAVPKKSALKKKSGGGSGSSTPSNQEISNRLLRQDNNSVG